MSTTGAGTTSEGVPAGVWSRDRVLALAPDQSSLKAALTSSSPSRWSGTGGDERVLWGECAGSGKSGYQVLVDLEGPAYKCSCPSRKFPCKHALGLLLLRAAGGVPAAARSEAAASWLRTRDARAAVPARPDAAPDPAASARRAARRAGRVEAGLEELDRWLADQVRTGLAGAQREGYSYGAAVAARMVDAQAPGVASALRRLPGVVASGEGWTGRLLAELASLRLVVTASRRLADLPPELAADVDAQVGRPVRTEEVLTTPAVRDEWAVLGVRDVVQDRLTARRVWLRGARSGRVALVLTFSAQGQSPDTSLAAGTALEADLHFHPASQPLRAVLGRRHGAPRVLRSLPADGLAAAVAAHADAVAADPFARRWPVVAAGVVPVPGEPWHLVGEGRALALDAGGADVWRLLAVSGGSPVTVTGELGERGLRPLGVLTDPRTGLVAL